MLCSSVFKDNVQVFLFVFGKIAYSFIKSVIFVKRKCMYILLISAINKHVRMHSQLHPKALASKNEYLMLYILLNTFKLNAVEKGR